MLLSDRIGIVVAVFVIGNSLEALCAEVLEGLCQFFNLILQSANINQRCPDIQEY